MFKEVNDLKAKGEELSRINATKKLGAVYTKLYDSAMKANERYFNTEFYDFWVYRFGEFLDFRTSKSVSHADIQVILGEIKEHFTSPHENLSPYEYYQEFNARMEDSTPLPGEVGLPSFLTQDSTGNEQMEHLSKTSELIKQMRAFYKRVHALDLTKHDDPIEFFSKYEKEFPIFARIARVVFAMSATSADVERLFSKSGLIVTKLRNRLLSEKVDMLTTLNCWMNGAEERMERCEDLTEKELRGKNRNAKFVTINAELQIIQPTPLPGDDSEEEEDSDEEDVEE